MNKDKVIHELKSFSTTFLAEYSLEASVFLLKLYDGDFSRAVLWGLLTAAWRTIVKLGLKMAFPGFFDKQLRKSK